MPPVPPHPLYKPLASPIYSLWNAVGLFRILTHSLSSPIMDQNVSLSVFLGIVPQKTQKYFSVRQQLLVFLCSSACFVLSAIKDIFSDILSAKLFQAFSSVLCIYKCMYNKNTIFIYIKHLPSKSAYLRRL